MVITKTTNLVKGYVKHAVNIKIIIITIHYFQLKKIMAMIEEGTRNEAKHNI